MLRFDRIPVGAVEICMAGFEFSQEIVNALLETPSFSAVE